jgi:hypothetical protein
MLLEKYPQLFHGFADSSLVIGAQDEQALGHYPFVVLGGVEVLDRCPLRRRPEHGVCVRSTVPKVVHANVLFVEGPWALSFGYLHAKEVMG